MRAVRCLRRRSRSDLQPALVCRALSPRDSTLALARLRFKAREHVSKGRHVADARTRVDAAAADFNAGTVRVVRRALALVAMMCLVGMIVGWARRLPRERRVRLRARPDRAPLTVLVPPGPAPRLIPSDSPNATRPRPVADPVPRMAPAGTGSGIVDYIAPFAGAGGAGESARLDYLLESGDSTPAREAVCTPLPVEPRDSDPS